MTTVLPDVDRQADTILVVAWVDPVVDQLGHDMRSDYVETFWLPILGPTSTWLARALAATVTSASHVPEVVDLDVAARMLGVGHRPSGRYSPIRRALDRLVHFGVARRYTSGPQTFGVRRRLPTLPERHVRRLPDVLIAAHQQVEGVRS